MGEVSIVFTQSVLDLSNVSMPADYLRAGGVFEIDCKAEFRQTLPFTGGH